MSPLYDFTVEFQDADGLVCQQALSINVDAGCGCGQNWTTDAAILCRLRIADYVDGMIPIAGPTCAAGGTVTWDGTFSIRNITAPPVIVTYDSTGLTFNRINGFSFAVSPNIAFHNGLTRWRLSVNCSAGLIWQGDVFDTCPIAIYAPSTDVFGVGPLTIEGYLPP